MISNFWSTSFAETGEVATIDNEPKRVAIKHKIPNEETHELAIDIYETEDRIYVVAPLAGVKSTDLEISVDENSLSIIGTRKNPFEEHNDKLYSSECFWGKFQRQLTLPSSIDAREISATFRNGILLIEGPRIAPSGKRKIKIN